MNPLVPSADSNHRLLWATLVYASFILTVDFARVGLTSDGVDVMRWGLIAPGLVLPAALILVRQAGSLRIFWTPSLFGVGAWAGLAVLSTLWSVSPRESLTIGVTIAGLVVVSAWSAHVLGKVFWSTAVVIGLGASLFAGLLVDAFGGELFSERSAGLMTSPTAAATASAITFVLALSLRGYGSRARMLGDIVALIAVLSVAFTETRTPIAAAFIALAAVVVAKSPRPFRPLVWMCAIVTFVAGVVVGLSSETLARAEDGTDLNTFTGRTTVWRIALDNIAERPFLGHGFGTSNGLFIEAAREGSVSWLAGNSHNLLLGAGLSLGLIGAVAVASTLLRLVRDTRSEPWLRAVIILVIANGATEAMINRPSPAVLVIAGVAGFYTRQRRAEPRTDRVADRAVEAGPWQQAGSDGR